MRLIHDGPHSRVWKVCGFVVKEVKAYLEFEIGWNEGRWLERLEGTHYPEICDYRNDELIMEHVGEPVTRETLPRDWRDQADTILKDLAIKDCAHNDIRPENILVNEDQNLFLIDFAWATRIGDPIPPEWPEGLGGAYKRGVHDFDDHYSLYKSLREVEGDF